MNVVSSPFGITAAGVNVDQFVLTNDAGMIAKVITYGARLTELHVSDRAGVFADVILGFDRLEPYLVPGCLFGATLGRYCGRITNARFLLNGKLFRLSPNAGADTLNGGLRGFDQIVWSATAFEADDRCGVTLTHLSRHMDEGFPGNLSVSVVYTLRNDDELEISYEAKTDRETIVNLSSRIYFNLAGIGSPRTADHIVTIRAAEYTPVDRKGRSARAAIAVFGTPLDCTRPASLASHIKLLRSGFAHNFVLTTGQTVDRERLPAVVLFEPANGRDMELRTTQSGIQFDSGNGLDGSMTGIGGIYDNHAALLLAPQGSPHALNQPNGTTLRPSGTYRQTNLYRFGTDRHSC